MIDIEPDAHERFVNIANQAKLNPSGSVLVPHYYFHKETRYSFVAQGSSSTEGGRPGLVIASERAIQKHGSSGKGAEEAKQRYQDIDAVAQLLRHGRMLDLCARLGVVCITDLPKKRASNSNKEGATPTHGQDATTHRLVYGTPDDLKKRSAKLREEEAIGVRLVEVHEVTRDAEKDVALLAKGEVPIYNDDERSVKRAIGWVGLPPNVAGALCDTAKRLAVSQEADAAEQRRSFMGMLDHYVSPVGILAIAKAGVDGKMEAYPLLGAESPKVRHVAREISGLAWAGAFEPYESGQESPPLTIDMLSIVDGVSKQLGPDLGDPLDPEVVQQRITDLHIGEWIGE